MNSQSNSPVIARSEAARQSHSKLKILFITRAYNENAGGMERLSWEFIENMKRNNKIEAHVVAYTGPRWASPLFIFTAIPQVFSLASKVDVVHLGDPLLSKLGWLVKVIFRKPIAVTVHGLDISYPNFLYQLYLRLNFRKFDLYLPISEATKELLLKHHVRGKIVVVHPGITDRLYNQQFAKSDLARVLKQNIEGKVILLTVGRLVKRKGHQWFIENVLPKLPNSVIYVIAGNGPEYENIKSSERVIKLGRVSDDDVAILYNTVDAFVQPNIKVEGDIEGFGLVLLEAALCQRSVFAADLEGMKDAIIDGQNGTLISSEDTSAWVAVLNDLVKNPRVSKKAREFTMENFSWAKKVEIAIEQFKKIAG